MAIATALNKDNYTGKNSNNIKLHVSWFVGLWKREIANIFINKFRLINLYRLRHIRKYDYIYQN